MRILVDADACPVKAVITRLAKQYKIAVVMVLDSSHIFSDGYSQVGLRRCRDGAWQRGARN